MNNILTKKCVKCNELKDEKEFYINHLMKTGLSSWCKKCHSSNASRFNKNNREHVNTIIRKRAYENPKLFWCSCTLRAHKTRGFNVKITKEELYNLISHKDFCDICGEKLSWERTPDKKEVKQTSPSLDRKNNDKIIDIDNIMILCRKCNTTKLNRTFEEFILYCKNVVEKFGDK